MGRPLVARRPGPGGGGGAPPPPVPAGAAGEPAQQHAGGGAPSPPAPQDGKSPSGGCRDSRSGSTEGISANSCNAQRRKALARGGDRAVDIDAAASILDHDHGKALAARVPGRVAYAKIEREPRHEDSSQASLAQGTGKAGGGLAVVLVEGGAGLDPRAEALAQNELGVRNLQVVVELRTGGVLNAVIRPQDLLSVG